MKVISLITERQWYYQPLANEIPSKSSQCLRFDLWSLCFFLFPPFPSVNMLMFPTLARFFVFSMLQNWNRNGIRIHNSRVKKTKNDLGLAVKMIHTVHCWEKEIRRKRESHAYWVSPGDSYTRNMVVEQLKDLWEIVGRRKRIYNCDKSHFPNMATNSHTSYLLWNVNLTFPFR